MKNNSSPAPRRSNNRKKFKNLDIWFSLVFLVAVTLFVTCDAIERRHDRKLIEQNPVQTEARIVEIGPEGKSGGSPVYYEFQVGDSTYQGWVCPGIKEARAMWVGQELLIVYQRSDPSNNRYVGTVGE